MPGTNLYQANDDYATTVANVPVTIDVLANDNCILNGLPCLTGSMVQSVTQPSKGVATINPDNTVTYSPNLRFVGTDSFTYTASDSTGLLTGTATVHLTVNQRGTSTTVTPGSSSVTAGGTLIFTATVSDTSSGTKTAPTGTVAWSDGGAGGSFSNGGTCTLSTGSSQSQCNVTYTASSTAGSVIITGRYSGDSAHTASSGASALTVNAGPPPSPHPTTTGVSPNPASVTTGSQIAFTAVVTDTSASPTAPSGSVSWSDGGKGGSFSSSTCLSGGTGQSQCSTTYTAPSAGGSVTITSSYSGDSSHTASSGTSSLTVNLHGTGTSVSPNPASVATGSTIAFTATVSDTSSGTKTAPTGTVAWSDGGAGGSFSNGGTCTLSTGSSQSQCNVTYTASSTAGSVTITGRYSGDPTHVAGSGTSSLTVNSTPPPSPHPTTTTVSPNPASATTGTQTTLTATVTDTSGSPTTPSGSVNWSDGGAGGSFSNGGTCTLSGSTSQSQCSTTYTAPSTSGSVTITATYSGDSTHAASSGTSSLTVSSPGGVTSKLTVNTQDLSGATLTGYWAQLDQNGNTVDSGYTPATFTLNNGQTYTVEADGFGSCPFGKWLDTGSANNQRTISITSDTSLVAVLNCGTPPSSHPTATGVSPNPTSVTTGGSMAFTATVTDTSSSPTTPSGTLAWSDGGAGGSFSNGGTCTLSGSTSQSQCSTTYTAPSTSGSVTITATYSGDSTHAASSGTSSLTVNAPSPPHPTTTSVSPNPASATAGTQMTFTAIVSDTSTSPSSPSGTVAWSDGGAGGSFGLTSCSLSSTSSSTSSCLTSYTAPSTASTVTITATYSGDSTHAASSGTSSLTLRAFVKQSSGLVAFDPLNNVTLNQQQLQAQSRYWTYGGSAQGENAPYSFYEDSQGFHIGVQAVAQGRYAGLYASNLNVPGQLFHAVITGPTQTVPAGVYNTGLYVQTSDGRINYVFCGEVTTLSGTVWEVASATGNTSFATSFTILWLDSSPNQPLTRSCTLVTNGSNSLLVYMDNTQVYSNSTLNLQMTGPFQVYLEVQSSYAGQLLTGTFTNFYATTGTSISVTNLPSNAATVQLVGPSGTILASSPVSNGVATLDIGNNTFPLSARIVVKSADGTTLVSSAVVFLWGGDTYAMASG